jgi:broad specificity phosphatase PhoE
MPMPEDLYLVRHGESEGNLVNARSRQGDDSLFTPEHLNRHSFEWHLTDRGIAQAKWDTSLSSNDWRAIERKTYSNEELLEMAARYPRLFAV